MDKRRPNLFMKVMNQSRWALLFWGALCLMPALAVAQPSLPAAHIAQSQPSGSVTGTVGYRQRIALPSNAIVEVKLQEVSRLDAPAVTIAEQTIETAGRQVPFAFALAYDPSRIDPRFTYVVQARITVEGELQWITTTAYRVITQGYPTTVDIMVEQARSSPGSSSPSAPTSSAPTSPPSSASSPSSRYDCAAQSSRYRDAENVGLEEAQRLLIQRDGKKFVYQCTPTSTSADEFRYDCDSQVTNVPDRSNVALPEAERLLMQREDSLFVYQCSPR